VAAESLAIFKTWGWWLHCKNVLNGRLQASPSDSQPEQFISIVPLIWIQKLIAV